MISVVLSGGVGSRLWPLSRGVYPKQLLALMHEEKTMLQQTVQRGQYVSGATKTLVICNEEHRFIVGEQLNAIKASSTNQALSTNIVLEPEGRNTAAAIALSALIVSQDDPEALMLVMPADHVIADQDSFKSAVELGKQAAKDGALVTFGVRPSSPETGYGYIRVGEVCTNGEHYVSEFKEKPSSDVAERYISSGDYLWNAGIFLFRANAFLEELQRCEPAVYQAVSLSVKGAFQDMDFTRVDAEAFLNCPNISVDYAVMERSEKVRVVPLECGWSDVGSWHSLWEASEKDQNGNAISGDVRARDTHNSHIVSESKLVATLGVKDHVVVETADAVLVAHRSQSEALAQLVKELQAEQRTQTEHHRKVYRPWGWYDSIDVGERFQVKRISVKPGAKLSVQRHQFRAEHWVVVRGTAEVRNGDQTFLLNENESTYIPIGAVHSLKNPSDTEAMEIIEVQSGSYLGEDDIERFEDLYGRKG